MKYEEKQESKKILKKFLLNLGCLKTLDEYNKFNIFDVLKISRAEIRHSNVLKWLLDPYECHGLKDGLIKEINKYCVNNGLNDEEAFRVLIMKEVDFIIKREWKNIDILVISNNAEYVLCIENKIDTNDHNEQLDRYSKIINDKYSQYTKIFLYLTPDGREPIESTKENWICISYGDLLIMLESLLKTTIVNEEINIFLENYIYILRREFQMDKEIEEICRKIYSENKEALDLIYEHLPDPVQNVSDILLKYCEELDKKNIIKLNKDKSIKSIIRFTTETLDRLMEKSNTDSAWRTENHYFYEITIKKNKDESVSFNTKLVLNSTGLMNEKHVKDQFDSIIKKSNVKPKKNWQFCTVKSSKQVKVKDLDNLPEEDDYSSYLFNQLKIQILDVIKVEEEIKNI